LVESLAAPFVALISNDEASREILDTVKAFVNEYGIK